MYNFWCFSNFSCLTFRTSTNHLHLQLNSFRTVLLKQCCNFGDTVTNNKQTRRGGHRDITYILLFFLSSSLCIHCRCAYLVSAACSTSFGTCTFFAAAAASLNFLHSLRCPPFFQWCTWHSRPQYCTVRHNLQGCNSRNGVLGLPQVEQQRMVGVVRPSCLSNI